MALVGEPRYGARIPELLNGLLRCECIVLNERADVDILLFPVKRRRDSVGGAPVLRRYASRLGFLALLGAAASGCGYRPIASAAADQRLCVRADTTRIPHPAAVQAALQGARRELASRGALDDARKAPCLVVSLTRVDESPTGLQGRGVEGAEAPFSRGTAVAVLGRAWVEAEPGGPPERDTGDMRRAVHVESRGGLGDALQHDRAVAAAAESLGAAIARSVLGLPSAADELP